MAAEQHAPAFRGRSTEREALDRRLAAARGGRRGVLVIRGEAGMGKTALLRLVAGRASGFRVLRVAGVESEMELPFAGLQQLCAPALDRVGALPGPQHEALRVAFGLASGQGRCGEQWRVAREALLALGAEGFAERARHDLLATGEKVRRRGEDTATSSRPRSGTSPGSRATGARTRRSAPSCSSAPAPSSGI